MPSYCRVMLKYQTSLQLGIQGQLVAHLVRDWIAAVFSNDVLACCTSTSVVWQNCPNIVGSLQRSVDISKKIVALNCYTYPLVWRCLSAHVEYVTSSFAQISKKKSDLYYGQLSVSSLHTILKFDSQSLTDIVANAVDVLFVAERGSLSLENRYGDWHHKLIVGFLFRHKSRGCQ